MYHIQELKRFEIDRAVFYAAEITCALQFLHGCNVIYRYLIIIIIIIMPRSVAEQAAVKKTNKYTAITADFHFEPIAVEILGLINESACEFL